MKSVTMSEAPRLLHPTLLHGNQPRVESKSDAYRFCGEPLKDRLLGNGLDSFEKQAVSWTHACTMQRRMRLLTVLAQSAQLAVVSMDAWPSCSACRGPPAAMAWVARV